MTLRLPAGVKRGVDRLAAKLGHKPAQIGARLIEEGLRRRDFPQIELRDTAAGRVAYLQGTRLAVYWVAKRIKQGLTVDELARDLDLPPARIQSALAYAAAYPDEIELDADEVEANQAWAEAQESAWRAGRSGGRDSKRRRQSTR